MKKRVLFFTENLYGGGVEKISQIILSHFDYSKYDVTLYSLREYEYDSTVFSPNLRYKYVYDTIHQSDSYVSKITKLVKNKVKLWVYSHCSPKTFFRLFVNENVDVAIAFIEGYAIKIVSGAPKKTRKIGWLHIELCNYHWTSVAFRNDEEEKECYLKMDSIPCVSSIVKQHADRYIGNNNKTIIIHNPIDCLKIHEKSSSNKSLYTGGRIHIVALGSLDERKGFTRLLSVIRRLRNESYNIDISILGKGRQMELLNEHIIENGMLEYAFLLGYKTNPYPFIAQADMYICSSFAEGYNTAITEALVLGKPVVSTECSGVKEQLGENNEWGICCENSEEGLYNGIKTMLSGNNLEHYAKQANTRGKCFSLDESMKEIYKIIEGHRVYKNQ